MPSQRSLREFVGAMDEAGFLKRINDEVRVDQIPRILKFREQTELALWESRTTLRFKGEFVLTAIDNDLFSRPRLL